MFLQRKGILVLTVFFLSLSLISCESDNHLQFCQDPPNDDTCLVDYNNQVNDVFSIMYSHYLENQIELKENYLVEDSSADHNFRFSSEKFLPNDLLDYTIIENENSVDGANLDHLIVFESIKTNRKVEISITFAISDNVFYIDNLECTVSKLTELSDDFEPSIVLKFEKFIDRINKGDLSENQICESLYRNSSAEYCSEQLDFFKNNELIYNVLTYNIVYSDHYEFVLQGKSNEYELTRLSVDVWIDINERELVLSFSDNLYFDNLNNIELDLNLSSLHAILKQLQSGSSVASIEENYNFKDNTFLSELIELLDKSYNLEITVFENSDDLFVITINKSYETIVLRICFEYDQTKDEYNLKPINSASSVVKDVNFSSILNDFVKDFNSSSGTDNDIGDYFKSNIPVNLYEMLESADNNINLLYFSTRDNGTYSVNFSTTNGNLLYDVDFTLQDDGTYKIDFTLDTNS